MANNDTTRFYVKDTEIVTVVEKLLANIKSAIYNASSSSGIDYTAILNDIERDLNSPDPSIPITDINSGDYTTAAIQSKQYRNTQYLKAILATLGQATNLSPTGLSLMGFIETITQYHFFAKLTNAGVFNVPSVAPISVALTSTVVRKLIIHNKGTSNVFISDPDIAPANTTDGLMIMPNEKLELEWVSFNNGVSIISETGTNQVSFHQINP